MLGIEGLLLIKLKYLIKFLAVMNNYKLKVISVLSLALLLVLFFIVYFNSKITIIHSDISLSVDFEEKWSVQLSDVKGGPSILDLDRDGEPEIIISGSSHIYCLSNSGETEWIFKNEFRSCGKSSFGDINADGKIDIVTNGRDGTFCVDHKGKFLWKNGYGTTTHNKPLVYDINSDGILEVLIIPDYSDPYIIDNKGNLVSHIDINYNDTWMFIGTSASPNVADINNDGKPEYLLITEEQTLHCLNFNFDELWQYSVGVGMVTPCFTDFEGDGFFEILLGSAFDEFSCLNYDGSLRWEYHTGGLTFYDPSLGDIDNNGEIEIVMSCDDYVFCLNETGDEIWRVNFTTNTPGFTALCDIENDGFLETVIPSEKGIYVVSHNGTILEVIGPGVWYGRSLCVSDINSDNTLEILAVVNNILVCIELNNSNSTTSWSTENGSIYRTGQFDKDGDGIDDFTEKYRFQTNVSSVDTDSDTLPDNWEVEYRLNPLVDDSLEDFDGDGFDNLEEYSRALNPRKWDNWARRYAIQLLPLWVFLGSLMVYVYVKGRPWSPKIVKLSKNIFNSIKKWMMKTAPIKEEYDIKEIERSYRLKKEKVENQERIERIF